MPSTLFKASVFLAFLFRAGARPQDQMRAGPFALGATNDWDSSGNYQIYSCGSEASEVKNILDRTYLSLQTAMLATDSPAYKAFFHSADPGSVIAVLTAITAGTNITDSLRGSRRPTLVCVNPIDPHIRSIRKICEDSDQTVVIQPPGTAIIFLCPIFFSRELMPQSTQCGVVNHANTALISQGYIAGSQYGFLVQTLAEMYLRQMMRGKKALGGDVRDLNACLALPPDQALVNPSNYAFYVSSKWSHSNTLKSFNGRR